MIDEARKSDYQIQFVIDVCLFYFSWIINKYSLREWNPYI